jgi:nicotinate-nucleotide adenylyltransferase
LARIGILGGTFDPPHNGHIAIAEAALKELRLDKIIFIPAGLPPHKTKRPVSSKADRLEMLRLTIKGKRQFEISEIEIDRAGPSYTVDTLRYLCEHNPHDQFFYLIGADNISEMETWRLPNEIIELVTVAVASRPGFTSSGIFRDKVIYFNMTAVDISSTKIRNRVKLNLPIEGLIPLDVEEYIREKGLYLDNG